MSASLKEKLRQIEGDLAEKNSTLVSKNQEVESAREAVAKSDSIDPSSEVFKAAEHALAERGRVADQINDLTNAQVSILKMMGQDPEGPARVKTAADNDVVEFLDPHADRLKAFASSHGRFGSYDLGEVVDRDALKADITGTTGSRRGPFGGYQTMARRSLSLLDVIPTGTMTGNSFPYVQEGGTYAAAETAEVTAKPEAGVTLTDAEAVAATIAHWKKIAKQALEDQSALQSIIDSHLRYGVLRRLEGQILVGNGTAPNMRGIRNTSGIQTQAFAASTPLATLVLQGIAKVFTAEGEANAVVVNPTDWVSIVTEREGGTSGGYLVGGNGAATQSATITLWGIPLIPNANQPAGFVTVGDFAQGATLLVRSGINVLLSDSDQDDFTKNRVTMLGEGRFALPVWKPGLFVDVDIAA